MRLLFITQKVDKNDTVLGFVHRWLTEFSKHFESIIVICLEKRHYDLPANVSVLSLGKEVAQSRVKCAKNLVRYIVQNRREYDAVLVHMNQEYILFGGLLWMLLGKKVFMWRNHYSGSFLTEIAAFFCTKVFCTSVSSYTAKYAKTRVMPVGVDVDVYAPRKEISRIPNSVLFLARMAPAKRAHILLEALGVLQARGIQFVAHLYGSPLPKDEVYLAGLKKRLLELRLSKQVQFLPGLPYTEGPNVYSAHEISVNLSPSGMYDKTIFEAAACQCVVLASSLDFAKIVDQRFIFPQDNVEVLADRLSVLLSLPQADTVRFGKDMRTLTSDKHSLAALGHRLYQEIAE